MIDKNNASKNIAVINTSKYWMVHGNGPTKIKHTTRESAITEAQRLSMEHPGQIFSVLESIECYHTYVPEPKRYEMK